MDSWIIRHSCSLLARKPQEGITIGVEPVPELSKAMGLKESEVCPLDKFAFGLIDAFYLWFQTLQEELVKLGFEASPFDPCMFILRHPKTKEFSGLLGVHVDDGIHGGDEFFHQQITKLEQKYSFSSKKTQSFTFTGIDIHQNTDNSIELSQSKYVKNTNPISLTPDRRAQEMEPEAERHALRGLIVSLQYAAVHTRPDLASALSHLQAQINQTTVSTLTTANRALHTAKKHHELTIRIKPIKTSDLILIGIFRRILCIKDQTRIACGNDHSCNSQGHFSKQNLCHKSNFMGNQKDSADCDQHFISCNISTFLSFGPIDLDLFVLGLDLESKYKMAKTRKYSKPT